MIDDLGLKSCLNTKVWPKTLVLQFCMIVHICYMSNLSHPIRLGMSLSGSLIGGTLSRHNSYYFM